MMDGRGVIQRIHEERLLSERVRDMLFLGSREAGP